MIRATRRFLCNDLVGLFLWLTIGCAFPTITQAAVSLHNPELSVTVNPQNGSYEIHASSLTAPVLESSVGAEVNHRWLLSSQYPHHAEAQSSFQDSLGEGEQETITFSGLSSEPDLVCILRLYNQLPYGTVKVDVVNHTAKTVSVQAIRDVNAIGSPLVNLGSVEGTDRMMFESPSEGPTIHIGGLDQAPKGGYWGVRDALIYNMRSKDSLLLAALTESKFMTSLRLKVHQPPMGSSTIGSLTVDSTGTTEAMVKRDDIAADQQIYLSLPVVPGKELSSELVMFAAGPYYHAQLEAYGAAVRRLHHALVKSKPPMGWWSWTAFYGGINQGEVMTNARWLSKHLKSFGFDYFHIDEGYDYARGEYTTTNATQFPDGMRRIGYKVTRLGLKLGVWTAPFEVSKRAWVYQHHKNWLVHDAHGQPIMIGYVTKHVDPLYVLDTTNPGAQRYLYKTYYTLTHEWGVRYIKLDFMCSSAIEGYRYRPHTTALQAQRIGLKIIRQAVGKHVLLDKDGSFMLSPVGFVNEGRIAPDMGHSFAASLDADPNIAARFYMDGNFFTSDPDAFSVSKEVEPQQSWHNQKTPLTFNEAEVQVVLAAVAGGMYEIGDDLPTLAASPRRLALVENKNLLRMVELHRAAIPLDLMSFSYQDKMPSEYFLKEDARQSMLAVFNFTDMPRTHSFELTQVGLPAGHPYEAYNALNGDKPIAIQAGHLVIAHQPPRSVRLIEIVDTSVPAAAPTVTMSVPKTAETGVALHLRAIAAKDGVPALSYHWNFGDGTSANGPDANHTFTRAADYNVKLTVDGVDGIAAEKSSPVSVTGILKTAFTLLKNRRYVGESSEYK